MKVFVADASPMLRHRIIALVSELRGVEVAGCAKGWHDTIDSVRDMQPDVVVLDGQLIHGTGKEMLKQIKRQHPGMAVIVLLPCPAPPYRNRSKQAGADYSLDKSMEIQRLREILHDLRRRYAAKSRSSP